jgi:SAM-dependent methyltransferase
MTTAPAAQPVPAPPAVAPNASLFLPAAYRQQPAALTHDSARDADSYWAPWRLADNGKWQYHVYQWAAALIRAHHLRSVLDVGCGPCVKLVRLIQPVCPDILGLDQPSALAAARAQGATFALREADLERPRIDLARTFDLILCADVIEHLADPDSALALIRCAAHADTLVVISTPERARERGRACMASTKPEHVREWTREEFERFLRSRGLTPIMHRLLPKDDADRAPAREAERDFRLKRRDTSPLCCQAWVCRLGDAPANRPNH